MVWKNKRYSDLKSDKLYWCFFPLRVQFLFLNLALMYFSGCRQCWGPSLGHVRAEKAQLPS